MLLSIRVPVGHTRGLQYVEQFLTVLRPSLGSRSSVSLEFRAIGGSVEVILRADKRLALLARQQLADIFPDAVVSVVSERPDKTMPEREVRELWLAPDVVLLRTAHDFEDTMSRTLTDPATLLFTALREASRRGASARLVLTIRRASEWRRGAARRVLARAARWQQSGKPRFARLYACMATHPALLIRTIAAVADAVPWRARSSCRALATTTNVKLDSPSLFAVRLRIEAVAATPSMRRHGVQQMAAALGTFTTSECRWRLLRKRTRRQGRGFLLSAAEIAAIWHPPTEMVRAAGLAASPFRQLEPPDNLPTPRKEEGLAVLGRIRFRERREQFGLRLDDRLRHLAVIGKTGMGKSTLLESLMAADMQAGNGITLIDPHGDLAEAVLARVPRRRTNDAIYFDAGDRDHPLAFNPLDCRDPWQRPLVASGIIAALKKLYGDSWGPRMEHILRNALLALLEQPESTLVSLQRLLSDSSFRARTTARLADPVVRGFWQDEFARWKPQLQTEAVAPIQNKVGQFLSHPILRRILTQPRSRLALRRVLDERRLLIVNLSKGRIGEDGSTLLGSLLVSSLQLAAMSRADVPESKRVDHFAYVDEFQNFSTEAFATILSEARKYRLSLTIANQYLRQLDEATSHAVFGNVGSLLAFQVGANDAELLAEQLGGDVLPADLMNLPKFTAYARLLIDGLPSRPFSLETLPPATARDPSRPAIIRRTSRHRYARRQSQVAPGPRDA